MLWLLFIIWPLISFALFLVINKKWNKKNHILLNIFYAITLLIFYPLEIIYFHLLRNKYNKTTKVVLTSLNKYGFKYHIVFGTFLFAFRDKNFRDTDIDICVYRKDFTKEQQETIKNLGFVLSEQWSLDGKISEQTYKHPKLKISMDIFHISRGEEFAPTFDEKNKRYARRPETLKYSLKEYTINGVVCNGPADGEKYLKWNYGIWKVKDSNYHWLHGSSSNPTIIVNDANIKYEKFD